MPKFYIPEHVKKERSEKNAAAKVANRDLCQAVGEHVALERQEILKKQESEQRQKIEKQIAERREAGDALNIELSELRDEGYQFSLSLARQKMQNRIETLTMDKNHYAGEVKKFDDKEMDSTFLIDELDKIETELSELNIDLELSTLSTKGVNHEKD